MLTNSFNLFTYRAHLIKEIIDKLSWAQNPNDNLIQDIIFNQVGLRPDLLTNDEREYIAQTVAEKWQRIHSI